MSRGHLSTIKYYQNSLKIRREESPKVKVSTAERNIKIHFVNGFVSPNPFINDQLVDQPRVTFINMHVRRNQCKCYSIGSGSWNVSRIYN